LSGEKQDVMKLAGGILFIIYGATTFFKKPKEVKVNEEGNTLQSPKDFILLGLKGFLLNFANPLVIFYWFSVITLGAKNEPHEEHRFYILYFLLTILITFFSFDLLKILGAKLLRPLITEKILIALNHFIGIISIYNKKNLSMLSWTRILMTCVKKRFDYVCIHIRMCLGTHNTTSLFRYFFLLMKPKLLFWNKVICRHEN
jgi:hypothetical protein